MAYPLGVSIQEGVTTGASPFQEGSKHNVALFWERKRGVPNVALKVTSLQEDAKVFGAVALDQFGGYVARHLFNNAGTYGAVVYGIRMLDVDNSLAATAEFTDGEGSPTTIFTMWAGQQGYKDPGTWANGSDGVRVQCYPIGHVNGVVDKYLFNIYYKNRVVETWEADTWETLISLINAKSYYLYLESGDLTKDISDVTEVTLDNGTYTAPSEAMYYPNGDPDNPEGLTVADNLDVQIIAVTEYQTLTMAQELKDYCNTHEKKPVGIYNLPYLSTSTDVETFANALQDAVTNCSAGYNFWVKTKDGFGSEIWTPSIGVIIGAGFIRVPENNRGLLHFPPAGVESVFRDVLDITPSSITKTTATNWVKRFSTNVAEYRRGYGFFLSSSRTNSTNPLYHSIHTRRITSYYARMMEDNLLWAVQKPITNEVRRSVYASLYSYFLSEYAKGALEQRITFDEACIISIQTSPDADRKTLYVVVDLILTEAAESIRIELNRNDNSLLTSVG